MVTIIQVDVVEVIGEAAAVVSFWQWKQVAGEILSESK